METLQDALEAAENAPSLLASPGLCNWSFRLCFDPEGFEGRLGPAFVGIFTMSKAILRFYSPPLLLAAELDLHHYSTWRQAICPHNFAGFAILDLT